MMIGRHLVAAKGYAIQQNSLYQSTGPLRHELSTDQIRNDEIGLQKGDSAGVYYSLYKLSLEGGEGSLIAQSLGHAYDSNLNREAEAGEGSEGGHGEILKLKGR